MWIETRSWPSFSFEERILTVSTNKVTSILFVPISCWSARSPHKAPCRVIRLQYICCCWSLHMRRISAFLLTLAEDFFIRHLHAYKYTTGNAKKVSPHRSGWILSIQRFKVLSSRRRQRTCGSRRIPATLIVTRACRKTPNLKDPQMTIGKWSHLTSHHPRPTWRAFVPTPAGYHVLNESRLHNLQKHHTNARSVPVVSCAGSTGTEQFRRPVAVRCRFRPVGAMRTLASL
jgi:hypothetical protein